MRPMGISIGTILTKLPDNWFEDLKKNNIEWVEVSQCQPTDTIDLSEDTCKLVTDNGIKIWSLHIPYGPLWDISIVDKTERKLVIDRIVPYFDLAKKYSVNYIILHPSFEAIYDYERAERIAAYKKSIPVLCDAAEKTGVIIAVENLPRTCLGNTSEEMLELMEADARIVMCCDTNHMLFEKSEDFIEKLKKYIKTIHISDYDGVDEKHWLPGEGIIDFKAIFQTLDSVNYDGVYMMELGRHKGGEDHEYTPKEAAGQLQKFFKENLN